MTLLLPKQTVVRDEKWRIHWRDESCILTGFFGNEHEAVDPAHIGTMGKSAKSPDDETLPVRHSLHLLGHQKGEMSMFRQHMPDWLLRECLRAYARQLYREAHSTSPQETEAAGR